MGIAVLGLLVGLFAGWLLWERDGWTPPPPLPIDVGSGRYVALGDSYVAGEGLEPWEGGTEDSPVGNRCHRSAIWAYSQLLTFAEDSKIVRVFRACSGAVTANAYDTPQ
jgi:hypothetical protein